MVVAEADVTEFVVVAVVVVVSVGRGVVESDDVTGDKPHTHPSLGQIRRGHNQHSQRP